MEALLSRTERKSIMGLVIRSYSVRPRDTDVDNERTTRNGAILPSQQNVDQAFETPFCSLHPGWKSWLMYQLCFLP